MKDIFVTAAELAASGLVPPKDKSTARRYALREKWRTRDGVRKGQVVVEFELPAELADKYLKSGSKSSAGAKTNFACAGGPPASATLAVDAPAGTIIAATAAEVAAVATGTLDAAYANRKSNLWLAYERADERAKGRAQERLQAVQLADELIASKTHTKKGAFAEVEQRLGAGADAVEIWYGTWLKGVERGDWLAALIDHHQGRPRQPTYDERLYQLSKSDYLRMDRPPFAACYRRAVKIAVAEGIDETRIPKSITLLRRLRAEVPWQSIKAARYGAEALHRTYPTQRRDRSMLHALECLNGDGYTWNVAVVWPDGEVRRPVQWSWQDVYSGMIVGWRIDKTENGGLLRLVTGDVARDYGLSEIYVLDNTRAAMNKWLTGRTPSRHRFKIRNDDPCGLLIRLGGRIVNTMPRIGGPSKPVERAHGDFDRDIARSPALVGAWLGTNPMTRPDAARTPIPLARFLEVVRQGIIEYNTRTGRRGSNCNGRSKAEVFRESYQRSVIQRPTAEHLRLCMLTAEKVQCQTSTGAIELFGNLFHDDDGDKKVSALAGQRCIVRYDPDALHKSIFVYSLDDKFVGEAKCYAPVGFLDQGAAREHNRRRRQNLKFYKKIAVNEQSMSALELAALQPQLPDPGPSTSRVVRMFKSKIEAPRPADFEDEPDEMQIHFERYQALKDRPSGSLSEDERVWLALYQAGPELRAMRRMGLAR